MYGVSFYLYVDNTYDENISKEVSSEMAITKVWRCLEN